eukprot:UN14489
MQAFLKFRMENMKRNCFFDINISNQR